MTEIPLVGPWTRIPPETLRTHFIATQLSLASRDHFTSTSNDNTNPSHGHNGNNFSLLQTAFRTFPSRSASKDRGVIINVLIAAKDGVKQLHCFKCSYRPMRSVMNNLCNLRDNWMRIWYRKKCRYQNTRKWHGDLGRCSTGLLKVEHNFQT